MSFLKPDPPQPPDPIRTAAGATATNVGTAIANQQMNNINQVTPQGALTYSQTGTYTYNDPTTGQSYQIPLTTATQSLSPDQQYLQSLGMQSQQNLAGLAAQQSGQLQNLLGSPFNPYTGNAGTASHPSATFDAQAYLSAYPDVAQAAASSGQNPYTFALEHYQNYGQTEGRTAGFPTIPGTPATPAAPAQGDINLLTGLPYAQTGFADVGGQQRYLGDAGAITRDYGPADNFSADRQRVEESLYGRIDPQLQRDRQALETRLQDQGIRYGSAAYNQAMDDWNRQSTDARLAVTAAGGQEQQRMMDMAAKRAGFQNAAQLQQFQEFQQRGTFANQAQVQDYQQAALRGQFANAGLAQNFARNQAVYGAQNQARAQSLAEQYAQRNQPINEISALMSGSQVKDPSFVNTPNQQIPTTDYAGLVNNAFSQNLQNYQVQSNNANQLIGGLFGAIAGAGKGIVSDRRIKENIHKIGTIFAPGAVSDADSDEPGRRAAYVRDVDQDEQKKLPIYEYSFKADPTSTRHIGPMAQDVEKLDKEAVFTRNGVKHIDKTRLGSILKVA